MLQIKIKRKILGINSVTSMLLSCQHFVNKPQMIYNQSDLNQQQGVTTTNHSSGHSDLIGEAAAENSGCPCSAVTPALARSLPAHYMQLRIKCVRHIIINNVEDILIVRLSPDVRSPIRPLALFQRIPYRDSVCRPMSIRQHRTRDIKTHIQTN